MNHGETMSHLLSRALPLCAVLALLGSGTAHAAGAASAEMHKQHARHDQHQHTGQSPRGGQAAASEAALVGYALIQPQHLPSLLRTMQGRSSELALDDAQRKALVELVLAARAQRTPLLEEARKLESEIGTAALAGETRAALATRLDRLQQVKREASEIEIDSSNRVRALLTPEQYARLLKIEEAARAPDLAAKLRGSEQAAAVQLRLIDAARYGESWAATAEIFRARISADAWARAASAAREPLGTLKTRQLRTLTHSTTLPDAPAGDYATLVYDSEFANGGTSKTATETVIVARADDGIWRLAGYFVK
jgi:Spy/CpxP family protein refolding chaperone